MNPVLDATGPLSLSAKIVHEHEDGTETVTRGTSAFRPERDSLFGDDGGGSGWNLWTSTPKNDSRVTRSRVATPDGTLEFVVLYAERITGALWGSVKRDTTRYQVCLDESDVAALVDFDPADFDPADFA